MFVISSYVQLPLRPFTCWYHGVYESTQPLNLRQARLDALRLALVASATGSWMVLLAFQLQAKFGSEVFYHGKLILKRVLQPRKSSK